MRRLVFCMLLFSLMMPTVSVQTPPPDDAVTIPVTFVAHSASNGSVISNAIFAIVDDYSVWLFQGEWIPCFEGEVLMVYAYADAHQPRVEQVTVPIVPPEYDFEPIEFHIDLYARVTVNASVWLEGNDLALRIASEDEGMFGHRSMWHPLGPAEYLTEPFLMVCASGWDVDYAGPPFYRKVTFGEYEMYLFNLNEFYFDPDMAPPHHYTETFGPWEMDDPTLTFENVSNVLSVALFEGYAVDDVTDLLFRLGWRLGTEFVMNATEEWHDITVHYEDLGVDLADVQFDDHVTTKDETTQPTTTPPEILDERVLVYAMLMGPLVVISLFLLVFFRYALHLRVRIRNVAIVLILLYIVAVALAVALFGWDVFDFPHDLLASRVMRRLVTTCPRRRF